VHAFMAMVRFLGDLDAERRGVTGGCVRWRDRLTTRQYWGALARSIASAWRRVVFPAPDGPVMAAVAPGASVSDRSLRMAMAARSFLVRSTVSASTLTRCGGAFSGEVDTGSP